MAKETPFIFKSLLNRPTRPNKRLGQHFLTDQSVLKKITAACRIELKDIIVEIGPGKGALTKYLAAYPNAIITVEKDKALCETLEQQFRNQKNISIVRADVLRWNPIPAVSGKKYIVAGNIPYYITGKLIPMLLQSWPRPQRIVLMVQKEVAGRMTAQPPHASIMSIMTQAYAAPRILFSVPRTRFYPKPKVDSAVIELVPRQLIPINNQKGFKKLVCAGFSHPRKYCISNICEKLPISKHACAAARASIFIQPTARAQEVSLALWMKLFALLKTQFF